jgi:hypothetical protein
MKVFISWSGEESHAVAKVLRDELPCVINAIEPFVSSEDIEKGVPWFQTIAKELETSFFGIVCLTASNHQSRWLHFEAGAIAAKVSHARVVPLLIGIDDSAVNPPLSQFQRTKIEEADFYKLLVAINSANKDKPLSDETLKRAFAIWWPQFHTKLKAAIASAPEKHLIKAHRSDRQILEEVLHSVRAMSNELQNRMPWDDQFRGISSLADLSRLAWDGNSAPYPVGGISGVTAHPKSTVRWVDPTQATKAIIGPKESPSS